MLVWRPESYVVVGIITCSQLHDPFEANFEGQDTSRKKEIATFLTTSKDRAEA